ncbi:hypothetical protein ACWGXJ_26315 [Paenibacillus sp. S33]
MLQLFKLVNYSYLKSDSYNKRRVGAIVDLFTPVVSEELFHPNFKAILNEPQAQKVLKGWLLGFSDRDNKFVKEFQTTFNSSFWEIYLHATFGNFGFSTDYGHSAPDFFITKNKKSIIVEAVTTQHSQDGTPEYNGVKTVELLKNIATSQEEAERVHSEIVHTATERISNSITNKSNKYIKSYSMLEHVKGKPFILALGAYEQPLFYYQASAPIQRVLYGLMKAEYRGDEPHYEVSDHIIKKSTGARIPIGIFNDSKFSHISGVLFSSVASFGKVRAMQPNKQKDIFFETYKFNSFGPEGLTEVVPHTKYKESLIDGLHLFLNPFAANPIDDALFSSPGLAKSYDLYTTEIQHGFLFKRSVTNLNSSKRSSHSFKY